jgi:outer membrane protein assembly factor BamD
MFEAQSMNRPPLLSPDILATGLLCLLMAAGCSNRDDNIIDGGAEQLLEDGRAAMINGNYAGAELNLQNLSIRYPFTSQARQAQLDLIYVYYRSNQPESALDVAETFEREYPTSPDVAYCLYMKGLIYFDDQPNVLERLFRVDITERPPDESYLAFAAFEELVRRFPNSDYVGDATQRMVFLRNRLATYENHVARYYYRRGAYVAAVDRAQHAIERFPGAPELEDSLNIMIDSYRALEMNDLAADAERILAENFGNSTVSSNN